MTGYQNNNSVEVNPAWRVKENYMTSKNKSQKADTSLQDIALG
jgi:hypothetical protein